MAGLVKDIVCGMEIEPASAAGKSVHDGTTYYFCAAGCKQAFDAEPAKYLDPAFEPAGMPSMEEKPRRWWEFWKV